jgi:hypothetical protein
MQIAFNSGRFKKNTRKRRKTKVLFLNNTTRGQIFLDSASEKVHIVV